MKAFHSVDWTKIILVFNITLGIILLASILINVGALLHRTSVSKGVMYSTDNDAGRAIQTAQLSRWYSSNHFAPYGNLYFRFAHTVAKLAPGYNVDEYNESEKDEALHHFALKLTSLFSITGMCLFLAWLLTRKWEYAIGLTVVLLKCSLYDEMLVKYIFRAHPDHLLMFATAVAAWFSFKYVTDRSDKNFRLSAIFWGIGFAVKRSLVLFIPSLFVMFLLEGLKKETFLKGFRFIGWMLASYLIVGFPQNFGFLKHLNFMVSESHNSQPADFESMAWYSTLLWNQTKYFLGPILLAHLFWGERIKVRISHSLIFVSIALVVLYARKMMSLSEHHTFPHAGMLIVLFVVLVQLLPVISFRYSQFLFTILFIGSSYFIPAQSEAIAKVYKHQNHCMKETFELLTLIKKEQSTGAILARDPYIPFDSSLGKQTRQYWGLTFKALEESKATLIGTNSTFSDRYLNPPPEFYSAEKKEGWGDKTEFYKLLVQANTFTTPSGKMFTKIYENKCGQSLWKGEIR